jgi:sporulation integral membrane protein YlbJ
VNRLLSRKKSHLLQTILWAGGTILTAVAMILSPQGTFQAALRGLEMWWHIVVPALFPFFIIAEMLLASGVVHFFGVLLEPLMRPLFNVPGTGAFVLAIGYTSGAPIGAIMTAKLRKENLCTRLEAERLIAFTSNASPLFMLGAVAVGMFHDPALGSLIAGSHYLANLCLGLCFRFYGKREAPSYGSPFPKTGIFRTAIATLTKTQTANYRPLGKLLGEAIGNSGRTLVTIGGFIIIFSVILQILSTIGFLQLISNTLRHALFFWNLDPHLANAMAHGLFEMTIGTKLATETVTPLRDQLLVTTLILGWAGLSIHAQVASVISHTDISINPFIIARLGHGLLAGFFATWLYHPTRTVFLNLAPLPLLKTPIYPASYFSFIAGSLFFAAMILIGLSILSGCCYLITKIHLIWLRVIR